MPDEVALEWIGDALAVTPTNLSSLIQLAAATPELERVADVLSLDSQAVGSRAPYFRAHSSGTDLILKLNLSADELHWSTVVGSAEADLAPRVVGSGTLAGTSVTWLLQERVACRLGTSRAENAVMMAAGARFHSFGRSYDGARSARGGHPERPAELIDELVVASGTEGAPVELGALVERAADDWERLTNCIIADWCHGDLHPGNVVRRSSESPGLLIGFNPRHAPWIFDAAWLAGTALVLDVKPTYRWLFDLLRIARERVLGERVSDSDFDRAVQLAAGWYAAMCWRRQPAERRNDPALRALVANTVRCAIA